MQFRIIEKSIVKELISGYFASSLHETLFIMVVRAFVKVRFITLLLCINLTFVYFGSLC